jgi:hypothetical protein
MRLSRVKFFNDSVLYMVFEFVNGLSQMKLSLLFDTS